MQRVVCGYSPINASIFTGTHSFNTQRKTQPEPLIGRNTMVGVVQIQFSTPSSMVGGEHTGKTYLASPMREMNLSFPYRQTDLKKTD